MRESPLTRGSENGRLVGFGWKIGKFGVGREISQKVLAEMMWFCASDGRQRGAFVFHLNEVDYVSLMGATGFDRGLYRSLNARRACVVSSLKKLYKKQMLIKN